MRCLSRLGVALVIPMLGFAARAEAKEPAAGQGTAAAAAFAEMKSTFGAVPSFMKLFPEAAVPAVWQEMKAFDMNPNTAIPGKYKNLISLAVSAQVPCTYCAYWDTRGAKVEGATQEEIAEAVTMASLTRKWSTVLNGSMQEEGAFRKEADAIFARAKNRAAAPAPTAVAVTDHASAVRDIEQTLGSVPTFFKRFPQPALAGAWLEFKTIQLNPQTKVPPKYKELIGLAVAAQVPCRYCAYFHAEAAKQNGATQPELDEAIAIAASTRHWSTFINGMQIDEKAFRKEADEMFRHLQRTSKVAPAVDEQRVKPASLKTPAQ